MSLLHDRVETNEEVRIIKRPIYKILSYLWWFLLWFSLIGLIDKNIFVPLVFISFFFYFISEIKIHQEIDTALKNKEVKVRGSFFFADPETIIILK